MDPHWAQSLVARTPLSTLRRCSPRAPQKNRHGSGSCVHRGQHQAPTIFLRDGCLEPTRSCRLSLLSSPGHFSACALGPSCLCPPQFPALEARVAAHFPLAFWMWMVRQGSWRLYLSHRQNLLSLTFPI